MRLVCIISLMALACLSCSRGSGSQALPRDWPPDDPANPERLELIEPDLEDPLAWWAANILSLVPPDIYQSASQAAEARRLVATTNEKRLAAGLEPVSLLSGLSRVAQAQAMDEGIRNYWNHRNPEGLGSHDRVLAAGLGGVIHGAENSAVARPGQSSVEQVVQEFSVHRGHSDLLYDPDVRYIGVGIYNYRSDEHVHYIQLMVGF